jgi:hypothetical protein
VAPQIVAFNELAKAAPRHIATCPEEPKEFMLVNEGIARRETNRSSVA